MPALLTISYRCMSSLTLLDAFHVRPCWQYAHFGVGSLGAGGGGVCYDNFKISARVWNDDVIAEVICWFAICTASKFSTLYAWNFSAVRFSNPETHGFVLNYFCILWVFSQI